MPATKNIHLKASVISFSKFSASLSAILFTIPSPSISKPNNPNLLTCTFTDGPNSPSYKSKSILILSIF